MSDEAAAAERGRRSLSLIVAMDQNGLIGRKGDLPWRLPNDLAHFKRNTLGKTILMGRRTWDSLGRPLPGRENWILSRDPAFAPQGARVFASLRAALDAHAGGELMIIGGADLYRQALREVQRIYLTQVLAALPAESDGDVHFPLRDLAGFVERSAEEHPADTRHAYPYRFVLLERS